MEEKDLNLIVEKLGTETSAKFDSLKEEFKQGFITEEIFSEQMKTFADEHKLDQLSENVENLGIELKKMAEAKKNEKPLTLKEQIKEKYDDLKKSVTEDRKAFNLQLKTNVTSASITNDSQGVYIPGFGQEAYRSTVFENAFQRFALPSNHHGTVYYVDQTTVTRNADNKDEAAAAPESALAWTQYSLGMGKILDSIPLTHEALLDIDQLEAEVRMFLMNNVRLKVDSNMWNGNGVLPNWKGIYTYATDFTAAIAIGATVDSIADASIYDLLLTLLTYVSNGKESKYEGNVIFMNPRDILKAKMKKDANNNYIIPPFVSRDGNMVGGATIIASAAVTANTLAIGDARHVRYYDVEGIDLEFGLDDDDFTKDLITLKARKRGNLLLREVDATAFYKVTDISTRLANITA